MRRRDMLKAGSLGSLGLLTQAAFPQGRKVRKNPPAPAPLQAGNWYEKSFFLLHLDHHTGPNDEVGRDADPDETARLIALSRPDVIQIHAKGNPGWTTYPTKIGHTPPKLARDVMQVWRDVARRNGCRFSAYYNLGRDGEIMARRPEWNRLKADGTPYVRALCYHSGVAEAYLWPMIDEILQRYQPDGFWFDGSCFTVSVCYCSKCRERFRRETTLDAPTKPDAPGWAEYKEMQRRIYREFVHETAQRIKSRKPACLVAVNWAFSLRMPEEPDPLIDNVTGDRAADVDVLSVDAHWYDGLSKPFDLMTTIFINEGGAFTLKPRGQMEQELAIIVANGGRYFAWDNPTPSSGLAPERSQYLAEVVAPFLRARQQWCLGSRRVPDVSLLNSSADHYAATLDSPVVFQFDKTRLVARTEVLSRHHLNYEMISSGRLTRGDIRSRLLVLDDPVALSQQELQATERWLASGGRLLLTGSRLARQIKSSAGSLFRLEKRLAETPPEELEQVLAQALPSGERHLIAQAPPTVEVTLRRLGADFILHFVNRATGAREMFDRPPGGRVRITGIPEAPATHVSVGLPARPRSVTVEPGGRPLKSWTYNKRRLELDLPPFAIHQMIVIRMS